MKKRYLFPLLLILLVIWNPYSAKAEESIMVYVDNQPLSFDTPPLIKNERTLVPLRAIFEKLGYSINWNPKDQTITGKKKSLTIKMQIGRRQAFLNDKAILVEAAPLLVDSQAMVPLRFIAESTDAKVYWNEAAKTVSITSKESINRPRTLSDSVVMITTDKQQGSGVILSKSGLIATNFHVLEGASTLKVTFQDSNIYTGNVVVTGFNTAKDIALLKINAVDLRPAKLGDSSKLSSGDPITAIGSPLGSKNLITEGSILGLSNGIISISAVLDHGSSGGGLFDSSENLIGITSSTNKSGKYFAMPVQEVKKLSTNGRFALSSLKQLNAEPPIPQNLAVHYEGTTAYLHWDYTYGPNFYYLYKLNPLSGEFEKQINPNNNTYEWHWGYPQSFGIDTNDLESAQFKIAAVKNGKTSPFSNSVNVINKQ